LINLTIFGNIVLRDKVLANGVVIVDEGIIRFVGDRNKAKPHGRVIEASEMLVTPGFIDIHCHAGRNIWVYEDPGTVADYHLSHGTTSMLCTLYRNLPHEKLLASIALIKDTMQRYTNILGVHLEGPYLNPELGSVKSRETRIRKDEYIELAQTGIIRQWTFSPEIEGSDIFLKDIQKFGIIPAIGHSSASLEQVNRAVTNGVGIVTHLFNATGTCISPSRYAGTSEVSFDSACMLNNDLYYEIICDKQGIHVRPDMIKLLIKTVGIEKIIGITDCCAGDLSDSDVNFFNNEIMGSNLTMDRVAMNLQKLGLSFSDIFKITAFNPACALAMENKIGSIRIGNYANLLITDENLNIYKIILHNSMEVISC